MRHKALPMVILLACSICAQEQSKRIGEIEFFGYAGVDLGKVRSALPIREGDAFNIDRGENTIAQVREAVKRATGRLPTDVSSTCCDRRNNWIIFIGLSGRTLSYNPQPKGTTRLPARITRLYERFMDANKQAVMRGVGEEDQSKGYALSKDPSLHAIQLEVRAYAIDHEALLREVLVNSADDAQRIVAAEFLGYARQSNEQLTSLAHASRDRSSAVRNNATRALAVLAASRSKIAAEIPAAGIVEQLLSGTWTDLNKASFLLSTITMNRDISLPKELREEQVVDRLIEMARWRTGHAIAAQYILGCIGRIDKRQLEELLNAGKVEIIIGKAHAQARQP